MRLEPPDVAVAEAVCFNATFLLNGSDETQQSNRIKAGGLWFESGRCMGVISLTTRQ